MLDAILLPIGEGNRVLGLIRGGSLREKVEIACKGDHEKMKNSINGVHAWLTDLIAYVTKLANGDMTATMGKASDQDQIHEWLVMLKNNTNALADDVGMLAKAAVDGKLAVRADASKHQGEFRKIVEGFNNTSGHGGRAAEIRRQPSLGAGVFGRGTNGGERPDGQQRGRNRDAGQCGVRGQRSRSPKTSRWWLPAASRCRPRSGRLPRVPTRRPRWPRPRSA